MGLLIDGNWQDRWYDTKETSGEFVRKESNFRNWVTVDGAAGATGDSGFAAAPDRYHLYVSRACPWAHRALIFRVLKGLQSLIGVSVVEPLMLENGWEISAESAASSPTPGVKYLYQVYQLADRGYTGRVTVPVLWDRERQTIVSNESSEIIRMFNKAFDAFTPIQTDFYPAAMKDEIDAVNQRIYQFVNNGVYRAGFATTQEAYESAFVELFATLDWLEEHLGQQRYLVGNQLTEADWRLFTTLVRFDAVYVGHFKCNLRRIADYANLSDYLRELYQVPGIAETVDFEQIKNHCYGCHKMINPTGIIPKGPILDLDKVHGRDRFA